MKFRNIFSLLILFLFFLEGCSECEKLNLSQDEKSWVNHFKTGQRSFYKSTKEQIDTIEVTEVRNFYTPCNKIELSKYQFEVYDASFIIKSVSKYNNDKCLLVYKTSSYEPRIPNIYFGNLGPRKNGLENKVPVAIDTIVEGVKLSSVYYYAKGLNTEEYGETERFKNFFWDKQSGLVAYTTVDGELFLRINQ